MLKLKLLGTTVLQSAVFTGAALLAQPAFAQEVAAEQDPPATLTAEQEVESGEDADCAANPTAAGCQAIVVTGSRIRRPNLESALPVTSVSGTEFFETGNVSVGDTLNDLPALRSTFSQSNSTRFLGTSGLNLLDLRGLGTVRTLVLQNGRRHVGGDVLSSGVTPDVNTIPTDLIERVDIVTGGNSAVYGSDAIAGVVNFILKDDYEGIQLRGQGGVSRYGDAGSYFIAGLAGTNFADGRGNVAVNVEYARQENAWGDDRKFLRDALTVVDSDPSGSDGNPDRVLNPDFRSSTFNNTGNIRFNTGQCGLDPQGAPYLCPFIFMPDGTLVAQTGERVGLGPNGQFIGGNGEGFFDKHQIQVFPQLDRYNVNLIGHFEISPAFVPFVEAKYSRTESVGTGASGPAFIAGGVLGDPFQLVGGYDRERISIDNPYLSPEVRDLICEQRALTITGALPCTATTRLVVQQALLGLGSRTEEARRNTFRIVGGIKGDIGDNWNYEASLNYGQLKEKTKILGNLDAQRFLLAMDAVRDPDSGQIVCRSQIDPAAAFGYNPYFYYQYYGADYPGADPNAPARLANDIAQCVPVNVLGGNFTQAQKDYVLKDTVAIGKTKQFDALAFISGDSSKWFELPGGPIGVVLGAEYRSDDLFYHQDEEVTLGYTFYNSIPTFDARKAKVKEAFGEIRLPLIKDVPALQEFEISGAARVSDYSLGTTGTVWAYNGSAVWSPIKGVRFRGNYARSVRAPNQVELFTPFGQNFSLVNDPCDKNNVGAGSDNRAANCIAAGIPAGTTITYSSSLPFLSGGNENLEAEKSDSITVGGVITPSFLPGFSFSADYYNIKVKSAISFVAAQTILNLCYDSADLNNPFCALFERAGADGVGGNNGVNFGIVPNSLHAAPVNFAKLKARGLDVEVAYRNNIGNIGRLDTRLTYTHVFELTNFVDPTDASFEDRVLSEIGDPKDAFNWNTSLQHGRFTFGYQMRYIGKMVLNFAEDIYSVNGDDPQNEDYFVKKFYPTRWYHDVRLGIDVTKNYNFYMGIDNLTDTKPPFNASGIGGGSSIYDSRGRFFYAGFQAKF
jgi:outer membrane receptor protein involved in Fe transport